MRPRRGITLIEVLVAILIMGIGMLALLVLFPLGALSMAQALRDDRVASAGANASALAVAWDVRNDAEVQTLFKSTPAGYQPPDPNGPGYPVYVDPYYRILSQTTLGHPALRRCTPSYVGTTVGTMTALDNTNRWFSLLDDLTFQDDATALSPLQRQGRYTWAYMLRRGRASSSTATEVLVATEVSVVVYSGRSTQTVAGEDSYTVSSGGTQGSNAVVLSWAPATQEKPAVRRGTWLLDVSYEEKPVPGFGGAKFYGTVHGHFYRVTNVVDNAGGPNTMQVELQTPLRLGNVTTMVVMENVAEVLERGADWQP
jgi:prepilin-type N-terminal cleavage/methylation domain-containing protein